MKVERERYACFSDGLIPGQTKSRRSPGAHAPGSRVNHKGEEGGEGPDQMDGGGDKKKEV